MEIEIYARVIPSREDGEESPEWAPCRGFLAVFAARNDRGGPLAAQTKTATREGVAPATLRMRWGYFSLKCDSEIVGTDGHILLPLPVSDPLARRYTAT